MPVKVPAGISDDLMARDDSSPALAAAAAEPAEALELLEGPPTTLPPAKPITRPTNRATITLGFMGLLDSLGDRARYPTVLSRRKASTWRGTRPKGLQAGANKA